MRRGDYSAAVGAFLEGLAIYRRHGPVVDEIALRRDLATVLAARGDPGGARRELLRAESLATQPGHSSPALMATLALTRADLEVEFNRLAEAERQYARAERLARVAGDHATRGAAQQGMGTVMLLREAYPRAHAALQLALRAQERRSDSRAAATTRLLIAHAHAQQGDTAAARRAVAQALDTLRALGDVAGEARALGAMAELEQRAGLSLSAESLYRHGLDRLGSRAAPGVAWPLHAGLAAALRGRGALAEAAAELRAAVEHIERTSATLTMEERRSAFSADKWDVFVELTLVESAIGRPQAAFAAAERLKARQMLDMLARGRIAPIADISGEMAMREQDLRRRISELSRHLESLPSRAEAMRGPSSAETNAGVVLEALGRAQEAYAELMLAMRQQDPAYSTLVRPAGISVKDISTALAPDEALLEYVVGDSTTIVFVVTVDSMVVVDLNVGHAELSAAVDFTRASLGSPTQGTARKAWRAPMRRLYGYLVAPIESRGLLDGRRRLIVAPHAELHYLPFAALVKPGGTDELLIDRYVIGYVPSAAVWLRLRGRARHPPTDGVLAMAPRPDALPASHTEVAALGRLFGARARVLSGPAATERMFRTLAPQREIVHLATYGVLNKHNPLFSFVELRPGSGDDGRLEVHEVFGLMLNARLLVLSACQTGLGAGTLADVPPGDDWVGLVRAFLFAGASNVMATLWPVEDRSTAWMMERFYVELAAGRAEDEALAFAQRSAARDPATAHPFHWAALVMVRGR